MRFRMSDTAPSQYSTESNASSDQESDLSSDERSKSSDSNDERPTEAELQPYQYEQEEGGAAASIEDEPSMGEARLTNTDW